MTKAIACAHRGLSAKHPENTLVAFRAAAEAGFAAIELDLRATHDGVAVVMHDANIARTTDGVGRVGDFDFAELRTHHTADGDIPTLDEAFASIPDWNGTWNLELKDPAALAPTIECIAKIGNQDRCILTAMDPSVLAKAARDAPDVARGLITLGSPDLDDLEAAQDTGCSWLMVDHDFMTNAVAHQAHAANMKVGAWTVNDPDEAVRLADHVDMVITDTDHVLRVLSL